MTDVMKLAMERRSRVTAEIERLKEEVNRLNQFIRMGESLISQAGSSGEVADPSATARPNGLDKPNTPAPAPASPVTGFPGSRPGA